MKPKHLTRRMRWKAVRKAQKRYRARLFAAYCRAVMAERHRKPHPLIVSPSEYRAAFALARALATGDA